MNPAITIVRLPCTTLLRYGVKLAVWGGAGADKMSWTGKAKNTHCAFKANNWPKKEYQ